MYYKFARVCATLSADGLSLGSVTQVWVTRLQSGSDIPSPTFDGRSGRMPFNTLVTTLISR